MADQKISADPQLTGANLAPKVDRIPILNISEADATKNQSILPDELFKGVKFRSALYKNNTPSSLTGSTSETVMDFFLIPANTVEEGDIHRLENICTKVGASGTVTIRLRVGTTLPVVGSAPPGGTTQLSLFTSVAGNLYMAHKRNIHFFSLTSQKIFPTASSSLQDIVGINSSSFDLTTDYTTDQYIMVTYQLANSGDAVTSRSFNDEVTR